MLFCRIALKIAAASWRTDQQVSSSRIPSVNALNLPLANKYQEWEQVSFIWSKLFGDRKSRKFILENETNGNANIKTHSRRNYKNRKTISKIEIPGSNFRDRMFIKLPSNRNLLMEAAKKETWLLHETERSEKSKLKRRENEEDAGMKSFWCLLCVFLQVFVT